MGDSRNAHSIDFGLIERPLMDVVALVRDGVADARDLKPGGEYTLSRRNDEGAIHVVTWRRDLPRDALPLIEEDPHTFDEVSFPLYVDLPDRRILEPRLTLRECRKGISVGMIFLSDVLEWAGSGWIIEMMDALLAPLRLEAAILCDQRDEGDVSRRVDGGEPVRSLILDRATGRDPLPPPLVGLVRSEMCDPAVREARVRGVTVWTTPRGFTGFSTVAVDAQSIPCGALPRPISTVIGLVRAALVEISGLSVDGDGGLPGADLAFVPFEIEGAPPLVRRAAAVLRSNGARTSVALSFTGNARAALGAKRLSEMLDELLARLGLESAVLCDAGEAFGMDDRGAELTTLIAARVRGEEAPTSPLLAVINADVVDPELWELARLRGVSVRVTPRGFAVFSTLER